MKLAKGNHVSSNRKKHSLTGNFGVLRSKKFRSWVLKIGLMIVMAVALFVIIAPVWPAIRFYLWDKLGIDQSVPVTRVVQVDLKQDNGRGLLHINKDGGAEKSPELRDNYLEIPKIGVRMPIATGPDESSLDGGHAWLRPGSVMPGQTGNLILTGHRFAYLSGGKTFYHLDKLTEGDEILVHWNSQVYRYVVKRSFVVSPEHTEIEAPSATSKLTLYTCTPLWTAKNRLVVVAEPT